MARHPAQHASDAGDIEHAYEVIERNLKLQNMLVEDILCAARLVQDKLELQKTLLDLRDSMDNAVDIVRPHRGQERG